MPKGQEKTSLPHSKLQAASLRALAALRPLVEQLRQSDAVVAEQLMRAATHVALEIFSAERWAPRSPRPHLLASLTATSEAMTLLRLMVDSRHCTWDVARPTYLELSATYLELMKRVAPKRRSRVKRDGRGRAA
ncbi:MAG: hypothetical protein EOO73_01095 [Myxococcales bacterium]|nr:MAG: hypothetical protein EOO73_01095 [Myxococcales bacterium]